MQVKLTKMSYIETLCKVQFIYDSGLFRVRSEHIKIYSLPIAPSGILFNKHGSGTVDRRPSMEIKIYTHGGKLFHDNWIHIKFYGCHHEVVNRHEIFIFLVAMILIYNETSDHNDIQSCFSTLIYIECFPIFILLRFPIFDKHNDKILYI
jgi:hypothetical protein